MAQDFEDEWEEEESLVVVELSGIIDSEMITSCDPTQCNILGLNSDKPLLQVDRCIFVGEYKDVIGTCLLFEETTKQDSEDVQPSTSTGSAERYNGRSLTYAGKTFKKLCMKRAFLSNKTEESQQSTDTDNEHVTSEPMVPATTRIAPEALLESNDAAEGVEPDAKQKKLDPELSTT